jgi:site-specific DNA-methyltransferase (adenine-specific)
MPNTKINYNPDVLNCLANLSNDEVFTPPDIVNQMLDLLPQELFSSPNTTFLDPASKSGVFLREIAKRLLKGLETQIPDLQERIDHIYKKQIFGIAITELTSLLSRRTLYCSKYPNSKYSVTKFDSVEGNIRFKEIKHEWKNNNCVFCGANKANYDREEALESHAYEFIHTTNPEELWNMKFDVIIGNPPYQMSDGGGTGSSAVPIYQFFIQQAKKLQPRYLSMIVPSRWFTGGRGLDEFRDEMLSDKRLRVLYDYLDGKDCFPGVEIKGGVSFFLWDRDNPGDCRVVSNIDKNIKNEMIRPLLEKNSTVFIRLNSSISIFRKIMKFNESSFSDIVSANDPFGFDVRVNNSYRRVKPSFELKPFEKSILFYYNGWRKEGIGYIDRDKIIKNKELIDGYKILIPKAWGTGNVLTDWLNPMKSEVASCCTETYLIVGPFISKNELENAYNYMQTKFFHILVSLVKITQNTMKKAYQFVPMQDFSEPWTDEKLYKKYGLNEEEIAFIESMIRPMDSSEEK